MSNHQSGHTEQAEAVVTTPHQDAPIGFFAIGIVINLVLITAYFVWAYKQWKKPGKGDGS